jgi:predicted permease
MLPRHDLSNALRRHRALPLIGHLRADLGYAVRYLRRTPAFTIPAVASLALGIAVTSTIFSVVNATLLRPLGPPGTGDLVRIGWATGEAQQFRSLTFDELEYVRARASTLRGIAGHQLEPVVLAGNDVTGTAASEIVTANYFAVLGVPAALGRGFAPNEDEPGVAAGVAVISDRFWRTRFSARRSALGSVMRLNGTPVTVIGVAPRGFVGTFPGVDVDLWVPAGMANAINPGETQRGQPSSLMLLGRTKPGTELATVRAELATLAVQIAADGTARNADDRLAVAIARGVHPALHRPARVVLSVLMAIVGLVLLIACANVSGMLLARASARRGELAVRLALGASRGRLVTQLLTESLVLALAGGFIGLVLALRAIGSLNGLTTATGPTGAPIFLALGMDYRVLAFTAVIAVATTVVFGLAPALQATRVDIASALKDAVVGSGKSRSRLQGALVIAQVTVAFVLMVGAGLLYRSLRNAHATDVGFDQDRVVVASFDLSRLGYDAPRTEAFFDELLLRVRSTPGVEHAALAEFIPMGRSGTMEVALPGGVTPDVSRRPRGFDAEAARREGDRPNVAYNRVTDAYLATLGQPVARGRDFQASDRAGSPPVVVVNEAMARRFWPGESPLGRRVQLGESEHEVVGVVADARFESFRGPVEPLALLPLQQRTPRPARLTLHVRTAAPATTLADIRRLTRDVDPNVAAQDASTLREAVASSLVPVVLGRGAFSIAGIIALILAAGGLYGLVAYTLERRMKEIGIRVTLGATRSDVFRVIIGRAARLTLIGVVGGVALASAATRVLSSLLYGLSPTDPVTYGVIGATLITVALGAGYVAARKGVTLDPMVVLRRD